MLQLGSIANGLVRTIRYFRGTKIIQNKFGEVGLEINPKGGITFLFEIDYNSKTLNFVCAVNREDSPFSTIDGKSECIRKILAAQSGELDVAFSLPLDETAPLVDQVYFALQDASEAGELKRKPFLRTLYKRMTEYDLQNAATEAFSEEAMPGQGAPVQASNDKFGAYDAGRVDFDAFAEAVLGIKRAA